MSDGASNEDDSIKAHVVFATNVVKVQPHHKFSSSSFRLASPLPILPQSSSIMAHPRLGIRPYAPEDLDRARLTVARSVMEPLAEANKQSLYLAIRLPSNFKVLTTPFLRLLSPTHNCGVGCTVIRLYRIYGLVAEFPELRWHSLLTYSHPCLRGRGRPNLCLFRLVS